MTESNYTIGGKDNRIYRGKPSVITDKELIKETEREATNIQNDIYEKRKEEPIEEILLKVLEAQKKKRQL